MNGFIKKKDLIHSDHTLMDVRERKRKKGRERKKQTNMHFIKKRKK